MNQNEFENENLDDKNESDKSVRAPMRRWQIVAEVLGSIFGVLFFIDLLSRFDIMPHIIIQIVYNVFGVSLLELRIAIIILCFVLVPAAIAFPIVIRRPKLLLIPVNVASFFMIVYLFLMYLFYV